MRYAVWVPLALGSAVAPVAVQSCWRPAPAALPVLDLASMIGTITAQYGLTPLNRRDCEQASIWSAWSALT